MTTVWDQMDGCEKQYCCVSAIYLISCLALEFFIDVSVGAPVHGKDVVGVLNTRDKWMIKLTMEKLLDTGLIRYNPIFFKFMQVHENEEGQAGSLEKEAKFVLSLLHTRYTKSKIIQEHANFSNRRYQIQDIKMCSIKMSTYLGIIGSFLVTQLLQKISE